MRSPMPLPGLRDILQIGLDHSRFPTMRWPWPLRAGQRFAGIFSAYTTDNSNVLPGIFRRQRHRRLPQGYVQNEVSTRAYFGSDRRRQGLAKRFQGLLH